MRSVIRFPLSLVLAWMLSLAMANDLTAAGTVLTVTASVTSTNSIGTPQASQATPFVTTVAPALAVRVTPLPADVPERISVPGTRVDVPLRVINLGNAAAPVRMALDLDLSGIAPQAVAVSVVNDVNCDGVRASTDAAIDLGQAGPHLSVPFRGELCLLLSLRFTAGAPVAGRVAFVLRVTEVLGGHPLPPGAAGANLRFAGAVRLSDSVPSFQVVAAQSSVPPGDSARYLLRVTHIPEVLQPQPETYLLRATPSPSAFTTSVTFHAADCAAGVTQALGAAVAQVGPIPPAGERCVLAVVPTARSAISGAQFRQQQGDLGRSLLFAALRASDPERVATVAQPLEILHVAGLEWGPSRNAVLRSPGEVTVTQTVRNTGNTAGVVSLGPVAALPAGSATVGFALAGSEFAPTLTLPLAAAGQTRSDGTPADQATVQVRVVGSTGLLGGAKVRTPVVATIRYGAGVEATPNVGIVEVLSLSTFDVVTGNLALDVDVCRSASPTPPCSGDDGSATESGDYLHYLITLRNDGGAPLTEVILTDPLPMFTRFVSVAASASFPGTVLFSADGTTFAPTPPTEIRTGGSVSVAVRTSGATGTAITGADQLPPGGEIRMEMVVQVR
jgi:trimeric autotransporter adhesin